MAGGKHASTSKSFEDLEFTRRERRQRINRFEEEEGDDELNVDSSILEANADEEEEYDDDDYYGDEPRIDYKKIAIIAGGIILVLVVIFGIYKLVSGGKEKPEEDNTPVQTEEMPSSVAGYKVLGQVIIKDLNIEQYILNLPEDEALKNGVVKIYGSSLNSHGNFCIAGHNYEGVFKDLEKLKVDDKITIKDSRNVEYEYKVTNVTTVDPDNLECLLQNKDKVEITLITCSTGATSRVVVKAEQIAKDNG